MRNYEVTSVEFNTVRARVFMCVCVCVRERERERESLHPTNKENNSNNKHEIRNSFNTTIGSSTE